QDGGDSAGLQHDLTFCPLCKRPPTAFDTYSGAQIITHLSVHQLYDPRTSRRDFPQEPCGLCSGGPNSCKIFLVKPSRGSKGKFQVDPHKSTCPRRFQTFHYASAARSTESSPCTNVPLICQLCGPEKPAVWRYNYHHHLRTTHPLASLPEFRAGFEISDEERQAMGLIWK
ncbi:hypothetical protein K488DRAFT_25730, partial [Vararia minispora EC-137]